MPLPTPGKMETKEKFVSRCMQDKTMKQEFPDTKQRTAVAEKQWSRQGTQPTHIPAKKPNNLP